MPVKLRHTGSVPQLRFWHCDASRKVLAGGVGSGKTRAGVIECFRMPAGSSGMIAAPTYPQLRDATIQSFVEIANRAGLIASHNQSNHVIELTNGTRIIYRSTSDPDSLRGPNIGWLWMDEAALISYEAWKILLGRLRLEPGKIWATTTPRGKNWLYRVLVEKGDGELFIAPTRSNVFNRKGFVEELEEDYAGTLFARQEIMGEFVDDTSDSLLPGEWLDRCCKAWRDGPKRGGHLRLAMDLGGGNGGDKTVLVTRDDMSMLDLRYSNRWGFPESASQAKQAVERWGITPQRLSWDNAGIGYGFGTSLEAHGIKGTSYGGGDKGGDRFANLRSAAGWALRTRLNPETKRDKKPIEPFAIAPEHMTLMRDELTGLKWSVNQERKIALQRKEDYRKELGHSPDFADAVVQSFAFLH